MSTGVLGVMETDATPAGQSLALRGAGASYSAFAWSGPSAVSLGQVNLGQSFTPVHAETGPGATGALALRMAGPNPFRGTTAVTITAPAGAPDVRVDVYDALGRRVAVLHAGPVADGDRLLALDGSQLAPGVYVVRALANREVASLRVVVGR